MSEALAWFGFTPVEALAATLVLFVAALVRGFGGFGFSMVAVTGMSLFYPPAHVIPMVLLLEVLASVHMLPSTWRHIDWHSLRWLLMGALIATPLGVWALAIAPPNAMRAVVSLAVLVGAIALRSGWKPQRAPSNGEILAAGALSGLLNGAASIGGPPVILFYFSSPAAISVSRASLIAYFMFSDIIALGWGSVFGLLDGSAVSRASLLAIPVAAGIALGQHRFRATEADAFRRAVLLILIVLSALGVGRALLG